ELRSLRIGRRQPAVAKRFRPPARGAEVLFEDYDRAAREAGAVPPPRPVPQAAETSDAEAPPAEGAAARAEMRTRAPMAVAAPAPTARGSFAPAGPPALPAPPAEDVLDDALLDFASLRMAGPNALQRGRLQPVGSSIAFEDLGGLEPQAVMQLAEQRALDTGA